MSQRGAYRIVNICARRPDTHDRHLMLGRDCYGKFQLRQKALRDLEKQAEQNLEKAEIEANRAAARESTPEKKASAFAKVLRRHGVEGTNEAELRQKFKK